MPFKESLDFFKNYSETRAEQIKKGDRLSWSTYKVEGYPGWLEKFDRKPEHDEWKAEVVDKEFPDGADWSKLIEIQTKIAWMCGAVRDIRTQFMAGPNDSQRTSVDWFRYQSSWEKWVEVNDVRFEKILEEFKKGLR